MISNQILQKYIDGLKISHELTLCVCDTDGNVLASTFADAENTDEIRSWLFVDRRQTAR